MVNSDNNNPPKRARKGIDKPNFTQIPNQFLDEVCPNLPPGQAWLLIWLARQTFGWHKDSVTISVPQIVKGTGMSERSVQGFIQNLVDLGHVDVKENWDKKLRLPSTYQLVLSGADPAPGVAQDEHQGGADPAPGGGADLTPVLLERNTTKENTITPIIPQTENQNQPQSQEGLELDSEEDLIGDGRRGFISNAYRRAGRPNPKLHTRSNEHIVQQLREAEERYGSAEFRQSLLKFLAEESDDLKRAGWPLYFFLKRLERNGTSQVFTRRGHTKPGFFSNTYPTLDTSPPPTQTPSEKHRLISLWNSAIPSRSFDDPERYLTLHPEYAAMMEKFETLAKKAAAIVKYAPDSTWLTLRWLCGDKEGYPNWRKLLSGSLDFKGQQQGTRGGKSQITVADMDEYFAEKKIKKAAEQTAKEFLKDADLSSNRL